MFTLIYLFIYLLILTEEYFPEVTGESAAHRKQRYTNYKECWDFMKNEIEVQSWFPLGLLQNDTEMQFLWKAVKCLIVTVKS